MKNAGTEVATVAGTPAPTLSVKVSEKDTLDVWVVGEGTPIVLIHGAFFGSLLKPLAEALAARGKYRAIWYRRRGYNGKPTEPVPVPEQARDVVKILDALEIRKAHVVGHSAGGLFALALAIEVPGRVLSAAFFDCMLPQVKSAGMLAELPPPVKASLESGDFAGAAAAFLAPLGVTEQLMERVVPGAWSALETGARTWFQVDAPILNQWTPDHEKFASLDLHFAWMESTPFPPIHETGELLAKWRPTLRVLESPTAHHFFPATASAETASVLDGWMESQGNRKQVDRLPSR